MFNADKILELSNEQMKPEQLCSSFLARNLTIFEELKMQVVKSPTDV